MKAFFQKRKKLVITLGVLLLLGMTLLVFRTSLLRGFGGYLIQEDELQRVECIFVLGGNSEDRGIYAAQLYHQGYTDKLVAIGENIPSVLAILDTNLTEGELTKAVFIKEGVPAEDIDLINHSTSTFEEIEYISSYCSDHKLKTIGIVSSRFHTRRIHKTFKKAFNGEHTEYFIFGAPSSQYDEALWWHTEEGMIMVNNEYMKLLYYFFNY